MPQQCAVPMCSSRKGGHKFPKDEIRLRQWVAAIRRKQFRPSEYSRVCKDHFSKDDYELPKDSVFDNPNPKLKKNAVPNIFSWNKVTHDSSSSSANMSPQLGHWPSSLSIGGSSLLKKEKITKGNKKVLLITNDIQSNQKSTTQNSVGVQCNTCGCQSKFPNDGHYKKKQFLFENVMDIYNPKEVQFFTGFQNFDHFKYIFSLFGEEVNHLKYYPRMKTLKRRVLSPIEEFSVAVIKLRRNTLYTELAIRFRINKVLLRNIFITWINYLYCKFKDLNLWAPEHLIDKSMRFTDKVNPCTVIIDCTETKIVNPENRSCNTFKVLVGISASGYITFVSDAYDGSLSDSELFEKCVCIYKQQSKDIILSDCGYVQDSVCHKNAPDAPNVNIPESLKNSDGKDETDQLKTSMNISPDIIHVKRLLGLSKTFKFLSSKLDVKLLPLADRIIFVCFMLTSFRNI